MTDALASIEKFRGAAYKMMSEPSLHVQEKVDSQGADVLIVGAVDCIALVGICCAGFIIARNLNIGYGALFSVPGNPVRRQAVHCGSHPCRAQATAALETEAMAASVAAQTLLSMFSQGHGLWTHGGLDDIPYAFLSEEPVEGLAVSAPNAHRYDFESHGVIEMLEKLFDNRGNLSVNALIWKRRRLTRNMPSRCWCRNLQPRSVRLNKKAKLCPAVCARRFREDLEVVMAAVTERLCPATRA
jgi:hypothetical protein